MKKYLIVVISILTLFPLIIIASNPKGSSRDLERQVNKIRAQEKRRLEQLKTRVKKLLDYDIELLQAALQIKVREKYQGAILVSYDRIIEESKYLGKVEDQFSVDSIFNEFGTYGSEFSHTSIWNEFGTYGSEFSFKSPFNEFTTTPPVILKNNNIIGYLTINKTIRGGVAPSWLKSFFIY